MASTGVMTYPGWFKACRQGSLLHESSERHLLGNDDQSSVWPLPKVPGCVNAKSRCRRTKSPTRLCGTRYTPLQSFTMRCPHVSPDKSWKYGLFPLQIPSCFTTCHGPFPVILARTGVVALNTVACIINQRHRSLAGRLQPHSRAIQRRTHTVSSCEYRFAHKCCTSVSLHQHPNIVILDPEYSAHTCSFFGGQNPISRHAFLRAG
jgi:hypothetical protein